jgi:hypothetical protein
LYRKSNIIWRARTFIDGFASGGEDGFEWEGFSPYLLKHIHKRGLLFITNRTTT